MLGFFEERKRSSSDRDAYQRRMDTFARLLEGRQTCVSIVLVNDTFYITANDFFKGTQERNKGYQFILRVTRYFSELANNEKSEEERTGIFKHLCEEHAKSIGKDSLINSKDVIKKVIELLSQQKTLSKDEISAQFRGTKSVALFWVEEFEKLYRDFKKLENSIIKKREEKGSENDAQGSNEINLTQVQFDAIKNNKFKILNQEPSGVPAGKENESKSKSTNLKIHAEVQLLSFLIGEIKGGKIAPQEFYFGISKLCCLNCRIMIESANAVFSADDQYKGFEIITRGRHDIQFANWELPNRFKDALNGGENETLENKIAKLAKEAGLILENENKPKDIVMQASPSSSDGSFSEYEEDVIEREPSLLERYNILQIYNEPSKRRTLDAIIKIHETDIFNNMLNPDTRRQLKLEKFIQDMMQELGKLSISITREDLENFLNDSTLAGKEISKYFKEIKAQSATEDTKIKAGEKRKSFLFSRFSESKRLKKDLHSSKEGSISPISKEESSPSNRESPGN